MSHQHNREILPYEDRVILAIQAIKEDASLSERRAAAIYNVRRSTLHDRRVGTTSQRDSESHRTLSDCVCDNDAVARYWRLTCLFEDVYAITVADHTF
jgi:hypothetical protein